jgi:hypothetical protein
MHLCAPRDYQDWEGILPALTQLEAVFLSANSPVDWDDPILLSFRTAFTNCLRQPTLTDVKISNINAFPLSALSHSSSIKRVLLLGNFSHLPSTSSLVYPSLDSLVLYNCSSMDIVTSWAQSRSLRSLEFDSRDFRPLSPFLEVCANTLTTLKIRIPHECTHFHILLLAYSDVS